MILFPPDPFPIPPASTRNTLWHSGGILLEDLWPEPPWKVLARTKRAEALAAIAMVRAGLGQRSKPDDTFGIPAIEWEEAFVRTVPKVRDILMDSLSAHEAFDLNQRLAGAMRTTVAEIRSANIERYLDFWSVGRGLVRPISPGSITLHQKELARWLPRMGWPWNDLALHASVVPAQLSSGAWGIVRLFGNQFQSVVPETFPTEAHALAVAISLAGKLGSRNVDIAETVEAKEVKREGPVQRSIGTSTPAYLVQTFGFKDVQFGPAVTKRGQIACSGHLADAFADLADVLGMPRHWIGLGGLYLAVGVRGTSGTADDFDARANVIHLPMSRLAGSIAAKWWLALEARLARSILKRPGFISSCADSPSLFDSLTPRIQRVLSQMSFIKEYLIPHSTYYLESRRRNQLSGRDVGLDRVEQLLARAFQAYVQDELLQRDRLSPWLAFGTLSHDEFNDGPLPYPRDAERSNLYQLFGTLLKALARND